MVYKWRNLKLKACQELSTRCQGGIYVALAQQIFIEQLQTGQKPENWRTNLKWLREQGWKIIKNWDIRCAKKLFEVFPNIIPKKYRGTMPMADYDINGNWIIIF